jgi:hypothetical protein
LTNGITKKEREGVPFAPFFGFLCTPVFFLSTLSHRHPAENLTTCLTRIVRCGSSMSSSVSSLEERERRRGKKRPKSERERERPETQLAT